MNILLSCAITYSSSTRNSGHSSSQQNFFLLSCEVFNDPTIFFFLNKELKNSENIFSSHVQYKNECVDSTRNLYCLINVSEFNQIEFSLTCPKQCFIALVEQKGFFLLKSVGMEKKWKCNVFLSLWTTFMAVHRKKIIHKVKNKRKKKLTKNVEIDIMQRSKHKHTHTNTKYDS